MMNKKRAITSGLLKNRVLCCLICLAVILQGCGGVVSETVESEEHDQWQPPAATAQPVAIKPVINNTDTAEYAVLAHYIHIKAAQFLNETGKYFVVADDLLAEMPELIQGRGVEAELLLQVSLEKVTENSGGTISLGFLSSQGKNVQVTVRVELTTVDNQTIAAKVETGRADKGSWGIIAKVNRDAMLKKEGFWEMDDSMLGIAASRGLESAINRL